MEWIQANWVAIGVVVLALHTFAKAIVRVTKTKKDDAIVAKIGSVLGYLWGKDPSA